MTQRITKTVIRNMMMADLSYTMSLHTFCSKHPKSVFESLLDEFKKKWVSIDEDDWLEGFIARAREMADIVYKKA
jgi:hypothetical protein